MVWSSQMAKNSKFHKALCQRIHVLPMMPSIWEPYSLRALWLGSPPNLLLYTIDRQPDIHTYLLLKQNTIPQQVKTIIPTHEPDCILSKALKHEEICLHSSRMPQKSYTQQKKPDTSELKMQLNLQLNLPCTPPCYQLR